MTDQVKEVFQRIQVSRGTLIIYHTSLVSPEQSWCDRGDADHQWRDSSADNCGQRHHGAGQSGMDLTIVIMMNIISTEAWCPSCPTRPELLSKKWTRKMISRASGSSLLSLRWPCPVPVNCLHLLMFQLLIAPDDTYILIVQQNKEKDDEEPKAESQEEG